MANPFDDVVETEKKYKEGEVTPKKVERIAPKSKDNINVSFSFNKRWFERIIFIIIIMVELYFILANPVCSDTIFSKDDTKAVDTATDDTMVEEEATKEPIPKEEPVVKEEPKEEPVVEEEPEEEVLPFDGNFDFRITDVSFERNDDDNPSKMTDIEISMVNRWKSFKPRVRVYWYDEESSDPIKEKIRAERLLPTIEKGKSQKITISQFDSRFFDPQNAAETIKVELYDSSDNNKLLDSSVITAS